MSPKKRSHSESYKPNTHDVDVKKIKLEEAKEELQCNICTELFVKAQTLVCSHTFCKFCIEEWRRKQSLCPLCRTSITAWFPTAVIDNIIEKLIESSSDEIKEQRRIIIEERNAIPGGSNNTDNNINVPVVPIPELGVVPDENNESSDQDEYSEYSSDYEDDWYQNDDYDYDGYDNDEYDNDDYDNDEYDNDEYDNDEYDNDEYDDDDDDDDDNDNEEYATVYYGGYGRCYICNRGGHWANGCPETGSNLIYINMF